MTPHRSTYPDHTLDETAVYWGNPQNDGKGGRTFDTPVEIDVRWEDRQELFADALLGKESISRAVVYVDQAVVLEGQLFRGELTDIPSSEDEDDPFDVTGAFPIRAITRKTNLKADITLRSAWL